MRGATVDVNKAFSQAVLLLEGVERLVEGVEDALGQHFVLHRRRRHLPCAPAPSRPAAPRPVSVLARLCDRARARGWGGVGTLSGCTLLMAFM